MNHFAKNISVLCAVCVPVFISACESSGTVSSRSGAPHPRVATWRCTDDISPAKITVTIRNLGSTLAISDSRGVETELPADPPGQRERYAKTGFALVLAGRTASWFVSGKRPTDCRR